MSDRTEFELGWDFAAFGRPLPKGATQNLIDGNVAGKTHFHGKTQQADIFQKKWLQLRFNAVKRHRVFEDGVTPDYLESICLGFCPISLQPLTVATMEDTDWSIDRIINDGGYAQPNLMVVTTRVNSAKGNKSLDEVRAIVDGNMIDNSLAYREWLRLFSVMQTVYFNTGLIDDHQYRVCPPLELRPIGLDFNYFDWLLTSFIAGGISANALKILPKDFREFLASFRKLCDDQKSKDLHHRISKRIEKKQRDVQFSAHVWNDTTLAYLEDLLAHLRSRGVWPHQIVQGQHKFGQARESSQQLQEVMAIGTRGYDVS